MAGEHRQGFRGSFVLLQLKTMKEDEKPGRAEPSRAEPYI
jgi:hypothetical protein